MPTHDPNFLRHLDLVALAEDVLLVENAPTPLAAVGPQGRLVNRAA